MTLEEVIKHFDEMSEIVEKQNDGEITLYRQLAEWLRELKKYRFIFEKVGKILADNGYTMDDLDTIFGKANDEEVNADEGNSN